MNVGSLSTAIDLIQTRDTCHEQLSLSIHRSTLTTAVCLIDVEFTLGYSCICHFLQHGQGCLADISLSIRATEDTVDGTTLDVDSCFTRAIAIGSKSITFCSRLLRGISRVILYQVVILITYVSTGVVITIRQLVSTVTASEEFQNLVGAINLDIGSWCGCSVTATIHLTYAGQSTTIDDNLSLTSF